MKVLSLLPLRLLLLLLFAAAVAVAVIIAFWALPPAALAMIDEGRIPGRHLIDYVRVDRGGWLLTLWNSAAGQSKGKVFKSGELLANLAKKSCYDEGGNIIRCRGVFQPSSDCPARTPPCSNHDAIPSVSAKNMQAKSKSRNNAGRCFSAGVPWTFRGQSISLPRGELRARNHHGHSQEHQRFLGHGKRLGGGAGNIGRLHFPECFRRWHRFGPFQLI